MSATKRYIIEHPYYRQGVLYEPGSVVTIPADEPPSRTWMPYEEPKPAAPTGAPDAKGKPKRPSDGEPI